MAQSRTTIGLDAVSPEAFERFGQALLSDELGLGEFVPTGGVKDGGADGFRVLVAENDPATFAQVSKQVTLERKVRATVNALRKEGRTVRRVILVTHLVVPKPDLMARELEDELAVRIDIRPASWIEAAVATSSSAAAAWDRYVEPAIEPIARRRPFAPRVESRHVRNVDPLLYMQDEFDTSKGGRSRDMALDGLILWALEGTDPDQGILRDRSSIVELINSALPGSRLTDNVQAIQNRLDALSSKVGGRMIKHHKRENAYCLPFETRSEIDERARADEALDLAFRQTLLARATERGADEKEADLLVEVLIETLRRALEVQGTRLAAFLAAKGDEGSLDRDIALEDVVIAVIQESDEMKGKRAVVLTDIAVDALRVLIYQASPLEREYLARMAKTYALFFMLDAVPSVADYFDEVTSEFNIYVGSDILIRALSEEYLDPAQQTTRITLEMLVSAGSRLYLAGPVLNEVHHHIRNSDIEFERVFGPAAEIVDHDIAKHSPKILIRALYWARRQRPKDKINWPGLLNRFVDYNKVGTPEGEDQLRDYLCHQFHMEFLSEAGMRENLPDEDVRRLADDFMGFKQKDVLRVNDALMCLHVVSQRDLLGESKLRTEFGLKTWWLTNEKRVRNVRLPDGRTVSHVAMRPTFLTEWMSVTPRARTVRGEFRTRFPAVQGLHITRRVPREAFASCMAKARAAVELPEARRVAQMASLVDELKAQGRRGGDMRE